METLSRLLSRQAEAPDLDFTSTLDLSSPRDVVELAKDVAARAVNGGYLVIGADDLGSLTGGLSSEPALFFDEARLRGKLKKWLPDDLGLATGGHVVEGKTAAAGATSGGWCRSRSTSDSLQARFLQHSQGKSPRTALTAPDNAPDRHFRRGGMVGSTAR